MAQGLAAQPGQRSEAPVETKLPATIAHEVQGGEYGLACGQPQTTAESPDEDGGVFGRAQEQDRVDLGDIQAFVEQIDSEQDVDLSVAQRV